MKKYLDLILLGVAAFFSLLVFVWMALPALVGDYGFLGSGTVNGYRVIENAGGVGVAFIFMIIVFLVAACLCTLALLKFLGKSKFELPFAHFIALGAAVLALVAMILFFLVEPMYLDGETSEYVSLGAGAVLCAISALLSAAGLGVFGALKLLKK